MLYLISLGIHRRVRVLELNLLSFKAGKDNSPTAALCYSSDTTSVCHYEIRLDVLPGNRDRKCENQKSYHRIIDKVHQKLIQLAIRY